MAATVRRQCRGRMILASATLRQGVRVAPETRGCDWKWVRSCRLKPAFRPQWNAGFSRQPRSAHPHLITPREPPVLLATDETRMEHGRARDALIWLDCVTAQEQIGVAMKRLVFFSGAAFGWIAFAAFICWFVTGMIAAEPTPARMALVRVADLDVGETQEVELADRKSVRVKLLSVAETRDAMRDAVRQALVKVEINGQSLV